MGKLIAGILAIIVVIGLIFTVLGFAFGWLGKAAEVAGPENVSKQYDLVITDWNALTTAADNACSAQKGAKGESDPTFVENPAQAYIATYRNLRTEYNATQANIFKAKAVGPRGYPSFVPNFPESTGANPDFCQVSTQLATMEG